MPQKKELLVRVPAGEKITLEGEVIRPPHSCGVIIFAQETGSNGINLRSELVAQALNKEGFATVLIDLLNPGENKAVQGESKVMLLKERLSAVTAWVSRDPWLQKLDIGYFATSASAAAALLLGMESNNTACAIVCRAGEFTHAIDYAGKVNVPVLLLAGEKDAEGVEMSRRLFAELNTVKDMQVVKGASHYFTELGKLGEVAFLAVKWFKKHLVKKKI